jgi:hypothetical protein
MFLKCKLIEFHGVLFTEEIYRLDKPNQSPPKDTFYIISLEFKFILVFCKIIRIYPPFSKTTSQSMLNVFLPRPSEKKTSNYDLVFSNKHMICNYRVFKGYYIETYYFAYFKWGRETK